MQARLIAGLLGVLSLDAAAHAAPYVSTYEAAASAPTLIRGATVLTGTGLRLDNADVLLEDGLIAAVGQSLSAPPGARVLEARGRWVTPGLIDVHSHLGVYPMPGGAGIADGNEGTAPITADVWAEHSIHPQDPGFERALGGGVTAMQLLPGSANLIGGRSVVVKNVPAVTYQQMKFPDAPHGIKFACGENPKRVYGSQGQAPMTRMANVALVRQAFADAQDYAVRWQKYERDRAEWLESKGARPVKPTKQAAASEDAEMPEPTPPKRDLKLETLVGVLQGNINVHVHCYRADDMATMLDLAEEFGFRITAFHHAVEAYKIADLLASKKVCAAMWADWWGFKLEAFDGVQENIAAVDHPKGGCAIVHSDSPEGIERLNQEAAKAMMRGHEAGLEIAPERAIGWITLNAASALGIDSHVGSLERGKMADLVIWSGNPFSVYALADQVFIDGVLQFDRARSVAPRSDFLLGQPGAEDMP